MKLIVGLGNYGVKYAATRHNVGFMVLDEVARKLNVLNFKQQFKAEVALITVKQEKVLLMKPLTYMNLSGEAVIAACNFYKIATEDILIIHDDLDLPVGKLRLRQKGSAGGQKGMGNIMQHLHTQELCRIKVGIGRNPLIPVVDYVLGKFSAEDQQVLNPIIDQASEAAIAFIQQDFAKVMNKFN